MSKGKTRRGTKIHLAIDGRGMVVEMMLSGAREHDVMAAKSLTEDVIGCTVIADKGYDAKWYRQALANQNNRVVIPPRKLWKQHVEFDETLYKQRGLIERIFGKIKENRRIATRFDKIDLSFLSFLCLAFIKLHLC